MKFVRKPLQPKKQLVQGRVHIIEDRCKGCLFCIELCPTRVLEESSRFNAKGYRPPVAVREELCVNCQVCFMICPEFAIYSTRVEDRSERDGRAGSDACGEVIGAVESLIAAGKG